MGKALGFRVSGLGFGVFVGLSLRSCSCVLVWRFLGLRVEGAFLGTGPKTRRFGAGVYGLGQKR